MQNGYVSPTEFHRILQEKEKYRKLIADINNQAMAKLKKDHERTARKNT